MRTPNPYLTSLDLSTIKDVTKFTTDRVEKIFTDEALEKIMKGARCVVCDPLFVNSSCGVGAPTGIISINNFPNGYQSLKIEHARSSTQYSSFTIIASESLTIEVPVKTNSRVWSFAEIRQNLVSSYIQCINQGLADKKDYKVCIATALEWNRE